MLNLTPDIDFFYNYQILVNFSIYDTGNLILNMTMSFFISHNANMLNYDK